jgi:hypothetical protein
MPDPVMPDPVMPDPVMPDPVMPDPVMPDPVMPDPVMPDPEESILKSFQLKTTNPCYGIECGSNGRCTDGSCICDYGYIGELCETKTACADVQCPPTATCKDGECVCNDGYVGKDCQQYDICWNTNCVSGTCDTSTGRCKCDPGMLGAECDIKDPCFEVSCGSNGKCVNNANESYSCKCDFGYSGDKCESYDNCAGMLCYNEGVCSNGVCQCADGYEGDYCRTYNPCWNTQCVNGGVCNNVTGGCICPKGFSGDNCEIEDKCYNKVCRNGGECNPSTGGCICPVDWYGERCETYAPTIPMTFCGSSSINNFILKGYVNGKFMGYLWSGSGDLRLNTDVAVADKLNYENGAITNYYDSSIKIEVEAINAKLLNKTNTPTNKYKLGETEEGYISIVGNSNYVIAVRQGMMPHPDNPGLYIPREGAYGTLLYTKDTNEYINEPNLELIPVTFFCETIQTTQVGICGKTNFITTNIDCYVDDSYLGGLFLDDVGFGPCVVKDKNSPISYDNGSIKTNGGLQQLVIKFIHGNPAEILQILYTSSEIKFGQLSDGTIAYLKDTNWRFGVKVSELNNQKQLIYCVDIRQNDGTFKLLTCLCLPKPKAFGAHLCNISEIPAMKIKVFPYPDKITVFNMTKSSNDVLGMTNSSYDTRVFKYINGELWDGNPDWNNTYDYGYRLVLPSMMSRNGAWAKITQTGTPAKIGMTPDGMISLIEDPNTVLGRYLGDYKIFWLSKSSYDTKYFSPLYFECDILKK